ncbi:histone-lysine N-methyltransferase SUV39H1 isoform X2 [Notamacropus eugenii]|uniref:histone-lysine N-methyltransferase SUV39H1 isoform X2 n=1 Tax=Notamacropus eugenii TaxID=9315 RepID=UPI003B683960
MGRPASPPRAGARARGRERAAGPPPGRGGDAQAGNSSADQARDCSVCGKSSWRQLQDLCRLAKTTCPELGISRNNLCIFEVDYLCNYKKVKEKEYYLVKWRGYPHSENTWEPRHNLRCAMTLKQFHRDLENELFRRSGRRPRARRRLDAALVDFLVQKAQQRKALQRWERELNAKRTHKGSISVENEVDLDEPPWNFTYINDYKLGKGITLNQMAVGCECRDCLGAPAKGCCPGVSMTKFAYNNQGQVRVKAGQPIYECNSRCRCSSDCPNRVVQRGISYNLCIFRTDNGRGWGVRTLQKIRSHSFVMEYVGEIITSEEAERRGEIYDQKGTTYLFDLDYVEDIYTVDAGNYGNVSHFVNHSCSPNLQVYNVFIDNLDERLPRIAFFATRTIWAGEELTFDYNMQVDPLDAESTHMDSNFGLAGLTGCPKKRVRIKCKCGTESCRKYLF